MSIDSCPITKEDKEADLTGAYLVHAKLAFTSFVGAEPTGANLIDADLTGVDLSAADSASPT